MTPSRIRPTWGTLLAAPSSPTYIYWEGVCLAQGHQSLSRVRRPLHRLHPGHIFIVLRRSPAEIASPSMSPRRRAAGAHSLLHHFARSRRRGCHRAKRVLNAEVPYVRYSIGWSARSSTTSTALTNASAYGLRGYVDILSPLVAMHLHG